MSQPLIDLQHISKSFDGELVLDDLNLSIKENSFVTLLGPSGCGKTTTLRILGGFTTPDSGKVMFDGEAVSYTHLLAGILAQGPEERCGNLTRPVSVSAEGKHD